MQAKGFILPALVATLLLSGCSGPVERWIVNTRIAQGDSALENGNARDAELAYRLALKVDSKNERARQGYVEAAADVAQELYSKGDFDGALSIVDGALKYDPQGVRLSAIKTTIDEAKIKREIVISNYPTYRDDSAQIQKAYEQLADANTAILKSLHRFSYTYDADDLTAAIKQSYDLEIDVARNTNRLIDYRQLVESGVPAKAGTQAQATGSSLLPLP